jgi:hypothetical protein
MYTSDKKAESLIQRLFKNMSPSVSNQNPRLSTTFHAIRFGPGALEVQAQQVLNTLPGGRDKL